MCIRDRRIILDVLRTTGITATAGIGPNLYLAKIAMDIYAKPVSYTHLDVYKRQGSKAWVANRIRYPGSPCRKR